MTDHALETSSDTLTAEDKAHGRDARSPSEIPVKGLKDVFWRLVHEISEDRATLISAGVTYYLLLSSFPTLGVLVSIYGLIADPASLSDNIQSLSAVLPPGATNIITEQLNGLLAQNRASLSFAFAFSLLAALWSANNGIKALFDAMNVAYEEKEKRGFIRLNLMSLAFTLGAVLVAIVTVIAVGIVPAVLAYFSLGSVAETLIRFLRWPIILLLVWCGIAALYRFGPSRENARIRWLSWGAGISTVFWLVTSIGFSYYLENFADYNATYGALGALIGLMVWIWLSVTIVIIGAEINAELEHQTARDTTTGEPEPMGERGAQVADTLGKFAD